MADRARHLPGPVGAAADDGTLGAECSAQADVSSSMVLALGLTFMAGRSAAAEDIRRNEELVEDDESGAPPA